MFWTGSSRKSSVSLHRQVSNLAFLYPLCFAMVPLEPIKKTILDKKTRRLNVCLTRGVHNCPPQIFLKFSRLKDSGIERCPSSKPAAEIRVSTLKIAFNFEQEVFFLDNLKPTIIPCTT